jgi:hypothetical protein
MFVFKYFSSRYFSIDNFAKNTIAHLNSLPFNRIVRPYFIIFTCNKEEKGRIRMESCPLEGELLQLDVHFRSVL